MRKFVISIICALSVAAQAQPLPITPQMFVPSPLGAVITVGMWLLQDSRKVYYIRVAGLGDTVEQARSNGFRLAVEQAVGTMVLSETEIRNQRIVRDEIITYASGFVDRFEILSTAQQNGRYRVTMDVWVGESKIARRLLNQSVGTGTIDGARLAVQVETLQQERQSADRVVETVVRDFPKRAFTVEVDRTQIDFDRNRTVNIEIPYRLSWNQAYVNALTESLQVGAQDRVNCWLVTPDCKARVDRQFHFNRLSFDDPQKLLIMLRHFNQNKPALQMRVTDRSGQVIRQICQGFVFSNTDNQPYHLPNNWMLEVQGNSVRLNSWLKLNGKMTMNLASISGINNAERVDIRVIPESECNS